MSTLNAILAILAIALFWLAHSVFFPWTGCGACPGGKKRNSSGTVWRDCRRCGGSGKRRRLGRVLIDALATKDEARSR